MSNTAVEPSPASASPTHAAPHAGVVGLQWGDEGKGKVVDLLTEQYDLIVRYNGGANAGHTVVIGKEKYALHLIPSGILNPGKLNIVSNGVVIDPATVLQEIDSLASRGVEVGTNLRISDRAHLVMPWHKVQDALNEAVLSASSGAGKKIGTTGRGIGPAYADKALRSTALRVGEMYDRAKFTEKVHHIVKVKNAMLGALAELAEVPFEAFNPAVLAEQYLEFAELLRPHVCDTTQLLHDSMKAGKRVLFEGANACMLDIDHGTYPYVTSSNCSSLGIYPGAGVPGGKVERMIGILKAYTTRVGGGPFPTELDNEIGAEIRKNGHEFGTTTGRPRRCGWLDLVVLKYSAMLCGATELGIMKLDVLAGFKTLEVCTAYNINGRPLEAFPADASVLAKITPVYQQFEGFSQDITTCRNWRELPPAAQRYIEMIERSVGVPVRVVSVGPERSQTLTRS